MVYMLSGLTGSNRSPRELIPGASSCPEVTEREMGLYGSESVPNEFDPRSGTPYLESSVRRFRWSVRVREAVFSARFPMLSRLDSRDCHGKFSEGNSSEPP